MAYIKEEEGTLESILRQNRGGAREDFGDSYPSIYKVINGKPVKNIKDLNKEMNNLSFTPTEKSVVRKHNQRKMRESIFKPKKQKIPHMIWKRVTPEGEEQFRLNTGGIVRRNKVNKKTTMMKGGSYKGKQHSYAAGGVVKDMKLINK